MTPTGRGMCFQINPDDGVAMVNQPPTPPRRFGPIIEYDGRDLSLSSDSVSPRRALSHANRQIFNCWNFRNAEAEVIQETRKR